MSNTTRNYLTDFDYRAHAHTASASQFDTFLTCPRKWWFQKVARLPELEGQRQFEFGDRLHEACERWLLADDQGRDRETGEPIELWPEGWDEGLSEFDASLVKRLVEKGIEEGVLRRTPDREVEAPVGVYNGRNYTPRQIVPGVGVCGYRDVRAPGLVEDHKSIKNRRYMKSQADLLADPQLLLYGAVDLIEHAEKGLPIPDEVTLRHNQFIKDPEDLYVRACEVQADRATIQEFWEQTLEPAAADMLRYKRELRDENRWSEVEGPRQKGACQAYGGCPFAKICGKVEKPATYRARIERANAIPAESPEPVTTKESTDMGIFNRLNAQPAAEKPAPAKPAPAVEAEAPAEEVAVATEEAETEAILPGKQPVPWANPDCKACKGVGFNKSGKPCAACDRVAEKEGNPRASSFNLEVDDAGYTHVIREADGETVAIVQLQAEEIRAAEKTQPAPESTKAKGAKKRNRFAKKAEEAPASVEEPNSEESPEAPEEPQASEQEPEQPAPEPEAPKAVKATTSDVEPSSEKTTGKGRAGRTATGFLLVYGAVRRTKMKLLDLNEVFHRYAAELAESQGVASFYQLDRFKRRDIMASKAAEIAETIPSSTIVVVRADDPDIRPFATALEPFASNVIEGLAS